MIHVPSSLARTTPLTGTYCDSRLIVFIASLDAVCAQDHGPHAATQRNSLPSVSSPSHLPSSSPAVAQSPAGTGVQPLDARQLELLETSHGHLLSGVDDARRLRSDSLASTSDISVGSARRCGPGRLRGTGLVLGLLWWPTSIAGKWLTSSVRTHR